jgi:hypothetical protein
LIDITKDLNKANKKARVLYGTLAFLFAYY